MDPNILQKVRRALEQMILKEVLHHKSGTNSGIQLSFIAPDSDFVAELGTDPVINCYLIGVNEDKDRKKSEPYNTRLNKDKTQVTLQKEPKFVDISYMITVWCKDRKGSAEIEHLLIGYLISSLGKYDFLPDQYVEQNGIDPGPYGIQFTLFGSENSEKVSGQVWQAMGSTPKPSLMLSLSVPVTIYPTDTLPAIQYIKNTAITKKPSDKGHLNEQKKPN